MGNTSSKVDVESLDKICDKEDEYDDYLIDLIETYLEDHSMQISKSGFMKTMIQDIVIFMVKEDEIWDCLQEKNIRELVEYVHQNINQYFDIMGIPLRQELSTGLRQELSDTDSAKDKSQIRSTLARITGHSNIKQRTKEWYQLRNQLFSASNIWKIFSDSTAQYNSLIYEKCVNQNQTQNSSEKWGTPDIQNTSNPRNWGIKYEPLSVLLYEHKYQTKVKSDYGCIPHMDVANICIGASPDGINIDLCSSRYGRLVEVKNIYNREIDGIPSEEYWTQMQIQMEVCNLDECDFLETRFKEYISEEEYWTDMSREQKGIILFLVPRNTNSSNHTLTHALTHTLTHALPKYIYMPMYVDSTDKWSVQTWITETQEQWKDYILYDTTYWYLDEFSCVLVKRNMVWFECAIPAIKQAWNTVLRERVTGYGHRAPNKRKDSFDGPEMENPGFKDNSGPDKNKKQKKNVLSKYFTEMTEEKMDVSNYEEKEHTVDVFLHNTVHLVKLDEFGNRQGRG